MTGKPVLTQVCAVRCHKAQCAWEIGFVSQQGETGGFRHGLNGVCCAWLYRNMLVSSNGSFLSFSA